MRVLFLGDIVGSSGRKVVKEYISNHRDEYDFIIANIENSASGFGITDRVYKEFQNMGISAMTGGNHTWDKKDTDINIQLWENFIRPANLPKNTPGIGYKEFILSSDSLKESDKSLLNNNNQFKIVVINLLGRIFMNPCNDPFEKFNEIYETIDKDAFIFVDFHGEATSEKKGFGYFVDGIANVVVGTHTHVQTNDLRLLPKGTLYLTDAGMNGAYESVLGMDVESAVNRLVSFGTKRLSVETNPPFILSGVSFDIEKNQNNNINSKFIISNYKLISEIIE